MFSDFSSFPDTLRIEKKVEPLDIGIDHGARNAMVTQGSRQTGNPRRRLTGFRNRGTNEQNLHGKSNLGRCPHLD
jgi:hypothetical protein